MRRTSFKVDAESVQGNEGAWIEFKNITRGVIRRLFDDNDQEVTVPGLIKEYVLDWGGFTDDGGKEMPSPKDEPDIVDTLYRNEEGEIVRLLVAGPVADQKN
jgi:hypothetical protein